MKISLSRLPDSKVRLVIAPSAEEFSRAEKEAFAALAGSLKLPGFRPGKLPEKVAREKISVGDIHREILESAAPRWIAAAEKKEGVNFLSPPSLTSFSPEKPELVVEATVFPEVELPDFKKLKVEKKPPVPVAGEEVEKEVAKILTRFDKKKLDDAAAAELSGGKFKTAAAVRAELRRQLEERNADLAEKVFLDALFAALDEKSKLERPAELIDQQAANSLEELKRRTGARFPVMLKEDGKTEEGVRGELAAAVEKQLRGDLVLGAFVEQEKIEIDAADLSSFFERLPPAERQRFETSAAARDDLLSFLRWRKAMLHLAEKISS